MCKTWAGTPGDEHRGTGVGARLRNIDTLVGIVDDPRSIPVVSEKTYRGAHLFWYAGTGGIAYCRVKIGTQSIHISITKMSAE